MAYTQDDLQAVQTAITKLATGQRVTEVRYAGRTMRFSELSLDKLKSVRDEIAASLRPRGSGPFMGKSHRIVQAGKGL